MNIDLTPIVGTLGPLYLMILIGAALKGLGILPAEVAPLISRVVMTLTLPALVFFSIRRAGNGEVPLDADLLLKVPLIAYIVILVSGGLAWAAGRFLELSRPQKGSLILASMFGSTAFLGYPIMTALASGSRIGPVGQTAHVIYSEIGNLMMLVTVGVAVASIYGEGNKFTWRSLLAVPRAAPFIALMIGLLFYNDTGVPKVVTDLTQQMGGTTSFLMMLYLGMSMVGTEVTAYWRTILASQVIKLIVGPVLGLILLGLLQLGTSTTAHDFVSAVVIDSATPSILLCLAYAAQYKLDMRLATALVFSSAVVSLITMAFWLGFALQGP
jgi:predicted permease